MKTELLRHIKNPLYWIVIGAGLSVRAVLAYFDGLYRSESFWELAAAFWSKIGSITVAFLILLTLIHLFSIDRETNTYPTINSTPYGRIRLFQRRLFAGIVATLVGVGILAIGNLALSSLFAGAHPFPQEMIWLFFYRAGIVAVGAAGYFLFAANMCDIFKNQAAAMCICGISFAINYFGNASAMKQFDVFWLLHYGFFAELVRGRPIYFVPWFWIAWYLLLLGGVLLIAINKRKECKEL